MTQQNPEQQPDPRTQEWAEQAMAQEAEAATEASLAHLQRRVVALNVEVRARDARIAELEADLAGRQGEGQVPDSGDQDG